MKTQGLSAEWRREQARKQQALQEAAAVARLNKAARLYDIARQTLPSPVAAGAAVVLANNVAAHVEANFSSAYFAEPRPSREWEEAMPVPLTPPFSRTFVEWFERRAYFIAAEPGNARYEPQVPRGTRLGVLIDDMALPDMDAHRMTLSLVGALEDDDPAAVHFGTCVAWLEGEYFSEIEEHDLRTDWQWRCVFTALMTLCFLHIRNVSVADVAPNEVLSRKYERHFGVPLTTYKVLKVTPMRKWRPDAPARDMGEAHLPKSLHIMRGHFKDYRNGAGLFGKYRDIFWWDSHVRGDESRGVTVKDYEVEAPA